MQTAASPAAYIAGLSGWQLRHAKALRKAARDQPALDERVKWGHLVYVANGPVCLIRAEESRVLLSFWRGQRLRHIEPTLCSWRTRWHGAASVSLVAGS